MASKKPDQVVYNEESGRYDAFLKPYPTNVGAPSISMIDSVAWKQVSARKANAQLKSSFEEVKDEYRKLLQKLEVNELVYNAKFTFEPIVGNTYHLYRNVTGAPFLSILSPEECNFDFINSFRLSADRLWEVTD
jgi:hypothetical protein